MNTQKRQMILMTKIKYHEGDLFQVLDESSTVGIVVPHVCNDKNGFGAGFVVPLSRRFPVVKDSYHRWHDNHPVASNVENTGAFQLGNVQFIEVMIEDQIYVANMIAQTLGSARPLYYHHLVHCMENVRDYCWSKNINTIIAPMFGSNLAGGNWLFIEELIADIWLSSSLDVTICYLKGQTPNNWTPPEN